MASLGVSRMLQVYSSALRLRPDTWKVLAQKFGYFFPLTSNLAVAHDRESQRKNSASELEEV